MTQPGFRRVALVLADPWAQVSTPLLMTARFLAQRGYQADLFVSYNARLEQMGICTPELYLPGVRVHVSKPRDDAPPVRLADGTPIPPEHWAAVDDARRCPAAYDWIVGFDPGGLCRAAALSEIWGAPYVYHSLELYDQPGPAKALERHLNRKALYSMTQDALRADALARLNGLDRKSVFISRNSSIGPVLPDKDPIFRQRFPIGERRVVLVTGTLLPCHCVDAILASTPAWPDEFVLVLHGWLPDDPFRLAVEQFVAQSSNVFLSTDIIPPEDKFRIFQGADVGLIFFSTESLNLRLAAGSSGKLYDCMRCGVPLVGNAIPGMAELVEETGCGLVTAEAGNLPLVLPALAKRYAHFQANCLETFPRFEFTKSYAPLLRLTQRLLELEP